VSGKADPAGHADTSRNIPGNPSEPRGRDSCGTLFANMIASSPIMGKPVRAGRRRGQRAGGPWSALGACGFTTRPSWKRPWTEDANHRRAGAAWTVAYFLHGLAAEGASGTAEMTPAGKRDFVDGTLLANRRRRRAAGCRRTRTACSAGARVARKHVEGRLPTRPAGRRKSTARSRRAAHIIAAAHESGSLVRGRSPAGKARARPDSKSGWTSWSRRVRGVGHYRRDRQHGAHPGDRRPRSADRVPVLA